MSATLVATTMTEDQAERITEQIAYRIDSITENYEVVMSLMRDALARNVHEALGYASPGAYIADRFGQSLQTLGAALRREFVHELSDAGLSTRAIAPVFGVSRQMISKDLKAGGNQVATSEQVIQGVSGGAGATYEPVEVEGITADARTGEVIEEPSANFAGSSEPVTTEHTITERTKNTVGLDGKTYKRPEPTAPRRRSLVDDAHTANKELFLAIQRIRDIENDDRYQRNKTDILAALQPSIGLATETLTRLAIN